MTLRRIATLAQALALIVILVPGLRPGGPSSAQAAVDPRAAERAASQTYDIAGKGIGCQVGRRRFKGPREPGDPPAPPGSKPSPTPSLLLADTGLDAGSTADSVDEGSEEPTAEAPTMLLASTGVRVAQVEPSAEPAAEPAEAAIPGEEPTIKPKSRRQARNAGLIPGIDISHHNGVIDFEQVKKTGRRFVFIKATQDTTFIDPMFPSNMSRARAAGLAAGAYHFFDYTLDGKAQADHFLDRVIRANGIDGALPPVVDVECWEPLGSSTHVVAEARLRDFVKRVYERTGRLPIIYASVRTWSEVVGNADGFTRLPLWAACWGCDLPPSLASGWDDWTFWQTGIDRVPGVKRLDGNFFNGSQRELNRLRLRPFNIEGGGVATSDTSVDLDLGGRDAVQLRSSPDGELWTPWRAVRDGARAELEAVEGEHTVYVQLRAGPGLRSPILSDSITLDLTGPEVSDVTVSLREGALVDDSAPVLLRWDARDQLAGLSDATVAISCGDDGPIRTEAPGSAAPGVQVAWQGEAFMEGDIACDVTAVSRDGAGNTTRRTVRDVTAAFISERPSSSVVYQGQWRRREDASALGGTVRTSASEDASITAAVQGQQVAIVALLGPDGGRAAVSIDGRPVGVIETYAVVASGPQVVLVADLEPGASRTVTVEPLGTSDSAARDAQVAIDGFIVLD